MLGEALVRERAEELGGIIDRLADMMGTIRYAFSHQRSGPLDEFGKMRDAVVEEIAFAAAKTDELMRGKSQEEREPCLRFQGVLVSFRKVAETAGGLAGPLGAQIGKGILFSDKASEQVEELFRRQEEIFHALADILRTGDGIRLEKVSGACRELAGLCLQFATEHEERLVEGLCLPQAAPIFLELLDRTESLMRGELETIELLAGNP